MISRVLRVVDHDDPDDGRVMRGRCTRRRVYADDSAWARGRVK